MGFSLPRVNSYSERLIGNHTCPRVGERNGGKGRESEGEGKSRGKRGRGSGGASPPKYFGLEPPLRRALLHRNIHEYDLYVHV